MEPPRARSTPESVLSPVGTRRAGSTRARTRTRSLSIGATATLADAVNVSGRYASNRSTSVARPACQPWAFAKSPLDASGSRTPAPSVTS